MTLGEQITLAEQLLKEEVLMAGEEVSPLKFFFQPRSYSPINGEIFIWPEPGSIYYYSGGLFYSQNGHTIREQKFSVHSCVQQSAATEELFNRYKEKATV